MIYVVEIPENGRPLAWFAFDPDDFARKVRAARKDDPRVVFAQSTPRQLLAEAGFSEPSPEATNALPDIAQIGEQHGWDTPVFRADYAFEPAGMWLTEAITELDACAAAVGEGRRDCRIYLSDQAAETAMNRDPLYQGNDGFYAHMALREQLIAMEVISDDL